MTIKKSITEPTLIIRFIFYPLVALAFVLALAIVLILANGYKPNFKNGQISLEKIGMFIVSTRPSDSQLYLNGKYQLNTSFFFLPRRVSGLLPGKYSLVIKKKGFREWSNTLDIFPGLVTWVNYVLLFPDSLKVEKVSIPEKAPIAKSENGRFWLFDESTTEKTTVNMYNLSDGTKKNYWPENIESLPEWQKKPNILSAVISPSSDRVLYTVKNGDVVEYLVTDGTGTSLKLQDLNSQFALTPENMIWNRFDNNEIYFRVKDALFRANTSVKDPGKPIITGVVDYYIDKNSQIYSVITQNNVSSIIKSGLDGASRITLVESVDPTISYRFAASPKQDALAYLNAKTKDLWLISPSSGDKTTISKILKNVDGFSWQKDGLKLLAWGDSYVARYDWERKKTTTFDVGGKVSSADWYFDDSHYLLNVDGKLFVTEFDGNYRNDISGSGVSTAEVDQQNNGTYFVKTENLKLVGYRFTSPY